MKPLIGYSLQSFLALIVQFESLLYTIPREKARGLFRGFLVKRFSESPHIWRFSHVAAYMYKSENNIQQLAASHLAFSVGNGYIWDDEFENLIVSHQKWYEFLGLNFDRGLSGMAFNDDDNGSCVIATIILMHSVEVHFYSRVLRFLYPKVWDAEYKPNEEDSLSLRYHFDEPYSWVASWEAFFSDNERILNLVFEEVKEEIFPDSIWSHLRFLLEEMKVALKSESLGEVFWSDSEKPPFFMGFSSAGCGGHQAIALSKDKTDYSNVYRVGQQIEWTSKNKKLRGIIMFIHANRKYPLKVWCYSKVKYYRVRFGGQKPKVVSQRYI